MLVQLSKCSRRKDKQKKKDKKRKSAGILGSGHPRKSLRRAASSLEEVFSIGAGVPVVSRPRGPGFPEYYWDPGAPRIIFLELVWWFFSVQSAGACPGNLGKRLPSSAPPRQRSNLGSYWWPNLQQPEKKCPPPCLPSPRKLALRKIDPDIFGVVAENFPQPESGGP